MNRALARNDRPVWTILRFPARLLDHPYALDQYLFLLRQHLQHLAVGPTVVAGNYLDVIPFLDVKFRSVHNTSGASEMIFMKFFSRSSRATGPKIRVPRGFKSLSIMTIALLSKRRLEPSSRLTGCLVRTTTARTTSPFFTVPLAAASFTLQLITSPIDAYRVDFPITPIIV